MTQEKPCCDTWKKNYFQIAKNFSEITQERHHYMEQTSSLKQKIDVLEKENQSLKQALVDLEVQVSGLKDEKEKEFAIRLDLQDEVFALEEEIEWLMMDGNHASREADGWLQERVNDAEKEINRLKELLVKEEARADSEKIKAEAEKKKAERALKEVRMEKVKVSEALGIAYIDRSMAERNKVLLEKLVKETDELTLTLASEKSKNEAADKILEAEKQKTIGERKRADVAMARVEAQRKLAELNLKKAEGVNQVEKKLKMENEALNSMLTLEKSKSEEAAKKLEIEKQKTAEEKKRADLAAANAKQQQALAEANLKQTRFEKDRANYLNRKLEEERSKTGKLEEELRERFCAVKLVSPDVSSTGKFADSATDVFRGTGERGASVLPVWIKNMLLEKEQDLIREKKRAKLETKKAKKQRKKAEKQKQIAAEEKHRADQLTKELEVYNQRLEESQKELAFYKTNADNALGCSNISEADSVKLLKKQLKLEKMLVKHAKKATKLEAIRNNLLHEELLHLKNEYSPQFQQRLDMLDDSPFRGSLGTDPLCVD